MGESDDAMEVLEQYLDRHNRAAEGGEPLPESPTIEVEGPGIRGLRKQAIIRAFRSSVLVSWSLRGVGIDVAMVNYAFREQPRIGGLMRIQRRGDAIARLTLRPGHSRIFALLDEERLAG